MMKPEQDPEQTVSLRGFEAEVLPEDHPESGARRVHPSPPPPDIVPGRTPASGSGRRFGKYELLGRFAQGGMAEIYLAREATQANFDRYLVLKCIRPAVAEHDDFLRMFRREARIALQLKHPHLCHIYEMGHEQGRYFLAMEWVEGMSLLDLIKRSAATQSHLPMPVVVKVLADIAAALDHAHNVRDRHGTKLGVVHRDVSPQNVAIGYDGTVKLLDFGVAKVHSEQTHTRAGMVAGKFGYMSPEQCRDERLDGRSDLFSLGVVLYEALTGRRLYQRATEYETMKAIIEEPAPSLMDLRPDLPESLDVLVRRALAKRPAERFASAGDMALAMQQFLSDRGELVTAGHVADVMSQYFAQDIRLGVPELATDTELMRSLPPQSVPPAPAPNEGSAERDEITLDFELDEPFAVPGTPAPGQRPSADRARRRMLHTQSLPVRAMRFVVQRPMATLASAAGAFLVLITLSFLGGVLAADSDEPEVASADPSLDVGPAPPTSAAPPTEAEPSPEAAGTASAGASGEGSPEREPAAAIGTRPPEPSPRLRITSDPEDVQVRIDGRRVKGRTPLTVDDLEPGEHDLTLLRRGYRSWRGTVTVPERGEATVDHALERRRYTNVNINTRPWSKVYVGHRQLGTTPIADARLPTGVVRLRFVDRDGTVHHRRVRVSRGMDGSLYYDLRE